MKNKPIIPYFQDMTYQKYCKQNIKYLEPMTAKAVLNDAELEKMVNSDEYIFEKKLDGTRSLIHFCSSKDNINAYYSICKCRYSGETDELFRFLTFSFNQEYKDELCKIISTEPDSNCYIARLVQSIGRPIRYISKEFSAVANEDNIFLFTKNSTVCFDSSYVQFIVKTAYELGLYYPNYHTRVFSRRVSKKTEWFVENSDSVPHLRDISVPGLEGTVLDGEMFIPNASFNEVSSSLLCNWDKSIYYQEIYGKIVLNVFDILFYKGADVRELPLVDRKKLMEDVLYQVSSEYLIKVPYNVCSSGTIITTDALKDVLSFTELQKYTYPHLYKDIEGKNLDRLGVVSLSTMGFYDYTVLTGGEGIMLKSLQGKYQGKRGREYQKVKKFLTKDVIILGFTEPTKEYTGKFHNPTEWRYWENNKGDLFDTSNKSHLKYVQNNIDECCPVTQHYFNGSIGNIIFGVLISSEEASKLKPKVYDSQCYAYHIGGEVRKVLITGECSGFDEEMREYFTENRDSLIGSVIEVKANDLFKDTGKLRHPRFLRLREDKIFDECTWEAYLTS